ncbi:hypothetical protein B0J13DRAFT_676973 [Dactylonectria estremocensis]|uniref:Uncharacterized protein n=1 Tax=Dactylonectria estremocensis TaxID=1079267 RepID=A0A9P9J1F6_9HYPO|nr:hypothetical protein B0J13DRAFT_676973 [Dactylonectria estremocensis]
MLASYLFALWACFLGIAAADCGNYPCDTLIPSYAQAQDGVCVFQPGGTNLFAVDFVVCPCYAEVEKANVAFTMANGVVSTTTGQLPNMGSTVVANSLQTVTLSFLVLTASFKPGSPVTVTHLGIRSALSTTTTSRITFAVNTQSTVYALATVTQTATTTQTISTDTFITMTTSSTLPVVTTSSRCVEGTVTETQIDTETTTTTTTPDAEYFTETDTFTETATETSTSTSNVAQETSTRLCTTGTLTEAALESTESTTSTVTPDPSTYIETVSECASTTEYLTQTIYDNPDEVTVFVDRTTTTETLPAGTITSVFTVTDVSRVITETVLTTKTVSRLCVYNDQSGRILKRAVGTLNCNAAATTTIPSGTITQQVTVTSTENVGPTIETTEVSTITPDPATVTTCSYDSDTETQTITNTETEIDTATTPTITVTSSSTQYETSIVTDTTTVYPDVLTTTVCSDVDATVTTTPIITETITVTADRSTTTSTTTTSSIRTILEDTTTRIAPTPATVTIYVTPAPATETMYTTDTVSVTTTECGEVVTTTRMVVVRETKYPNQNPPVCTGRPGRCGVYSA